MAPEIATPENVLRQLVDRPNLGFPRSFGVTGRLARHSRVRGAASGGLRYRFMVDLEEPGAQVSVYFSGGTLSRKSIFAKPAAIQPGARVFLLRHPGSEADTLFFVEDARETVLLLRRYVRHIDALNEKRRDELAMRFRWFLERGEAPDRPLCRELNEFRIESVLHTGLLLAATKERAPLLIALDRGERLVFFRERPELNRRTAANLTEPELEYLLHLVRGRYGRVLLHLRRGKTTLSDLGRKVFGTAPASRFSPMEREIVYALAARTPESMADPLETMPAAASPESTRYAPRPPAPASSRPGHRPSRMAASGLLSRTVLMESQEMRAMLAE